MCFILIVRQEDQEEEGDKVQAVMSEKNEEELKKKAEFKNMYSNLTNL